MIISYPSGAGGQWLMQVLNNMRLPDNAPNFHQHRANPYNISIVHELDPAKFDYVLTGKSYFNFYLNVLYKHFHYEKNIFSDSNYSSYFLQCVNLAKWLCEFDQIYKLVYFDFDQLIESPENFYKTILECQQTHDMVPLDHTQFEIKRQRYLDTCINTETVYKNFDNMYWVCFVLGQLMLDNVVPETFSISEKSNLDKCKVFAEQNFSRCQYTKVHHFDTKIFLPNPL